MENNLGENYRQRADRFNQEYKQLASRANLISLLRFVVVCAALVTFYFFVGEGSRPCLWITLGLVAVFLWLMNLHHSLGRKKLLAQKLSAVNQEELDYLETGKLSFENGAAYVNPDHSYTSDLDIFGEKSLYQHLNRTATFIGQETLARTLSQHSIPEEILQRQQAVREVAAGVEPRQRLYALARITDDSRDLYDRLLKWAILPGDRVSVVFTSLSYVLTALLSLSLLLYFFTMEDNWRDLSGSLFGLQLLLFFSQAAKVKRALFSGNKIDETLSAYAVMLEEVSRQNYEAPMLQQLQKTIQQSDAGKQIKQLARIYSGLEQVGNPFAAVIMNGLYGFHLHQLNRLHRWKQTYATHIQSWLQVIGNLEMLHSFGNFYYNNPDATFPELADDGSVLMMQSGHPLIPKAKRVCNDISFREHPFVILTGSNMSGKSTFLRSLGINMVLAGAGAPVCAASAVITPMPVFVSMRQSDSLADSESYFFAEVKRLQYITRQLEGGRCFVLLDEILRGTNSDDKRNGTVGVIINMIRNGATGAIATHDLEVCLTTNDYPQQLTNKCFEVEIVHDELVFDYRLRDGICKNKSASFLMKKMGII